MNEVNLIKPPKVVETTVDAALAVDAEAAVLAAAVAAAAESEAAAPEELPPEPEDKEYNVYMCARPSMHMCTPAGRDIRFTAGKCITDNAEVIEYLDSELEAGNRFITVDKAKRTITTSELDPMATLKRQHIKEYLAEQAAAAAAGPRTLGDTDNAAGGRRVRIGAQSTAELVTAGDSNSGKK